MSYVIEIPNYFEPHKATRHDVVAGSTVLDYLNARAGHEWEQFDLPTLIQHNGEPVMQADYATAKIKKGDVVTVTVLLGDPISLIVALVISIAIAVAVAFLLAPQPPSIGDTPEPDPTFSLKGQQNQIKLGQPIPAFFGRVRNWPDYAAKPYNEYIGNQQYQYSLFCLGHGSYVVDEPQIEDTPIANFEEIEIEVYLPGEPVTLFRNSVVTSSEVGNVELYGPNEPEYPGGPSGPFVLNDAFTAIDRIEVDITLPRGLYYSNDDGGLSNRTASWRFEYQSIDDNGVANGPWLVLNEDSKTLATVTPQRFTVGLDVPLGRYHLRAERTNDKDTSSRAGNVVTWETARGFFPNVEDYGDVTIVAMRALASNNLNDNSRNRFNVRQTRMLETYDSDLQVWGPREPTRNPIDAMIECFRAEYGGNFETAKFNFGILYALRDLFDTNNDDFDFGFERSSNLWEAARLTMSVGRAVPMLSGSQVIAIRDQVEANPVIIYTPELIHQNSFEWKIGFRKPNDPDGLEIEFIDENTWKPRTLLCTIDGEPGNNPEQLKLTGIINANKAYREGLYRRAKQLKQRQTFKITVGLDGHIPTLNSLVGIVHDVPQFGISGFLVQKAGQIFTLAEPVTMEAGKVYVIGFRRKDGSEAGPYLVNNVEGTTDTVEVLEVIPDSEDWYRRLTEEPIVYFFGEQGQEKLLCRVKSLQPNGTERVTIEMVNNDDSIFANDNAIAPPLPIINTRNDNDLPVVASLNVESVVGTVNQVQASWTPAVGATSYLLEISYDAGQTYQTVTSTNATSFIFAILPGDIIVRVAGINSGIGPFVTWSGTVGTANEAPLEITGLSLVTPFTGSAVKLQWNASGLATSYIVRAMKDDNTLLSETEVLSPAYNYDYEQADTDLTGQAQERSFNFRVDAKNSVGTTPGTLILSATNPPPAPVTGVSASIVTETAETWVVRVEYDSSPDTDIREYILYASDSSGFTPGPANIVGRGLTTLLEFTIAKPDPMVATTYYYIVEVVDVWGAAVASRTSEQNIVLSV